MKALVIGSGAREHTIAWALNRSPGLSGLSIAPGNAGTASLGTNHPEIDPLNVPSVVDLCRAECFDFVFVGPEDPLAAGIVDALDAADIPSFGPHRDAARLESSKVFSKEFMNRNGIPTADSRRFDNVDEFEKAVEKLNRRMVVKKDGLAAGKGVLESSDRGEILRFGKPMLQEGPLLLEEFLDGFEISIFIFMDGSRYRVFPPCADFKKAHEDDTGPNTGGMGAICPVPPVTQALLDTVERTIIQPTWSGLVKENLIYRGVLYFGLMITEDGPKVLEYNVRLGDPETQVMIPRIESNFADLCRVVCTGSMSDHTLKISAEGALGVVVASGGYPGRYKTGLPVESLPSENDALVFHAATRLEADGSVKTGGGRCFTAVGMDEDFRTASQKAYEGAAQIQFEGAWYRNDIGRRFFPNT